jgi:predicted phage terminase large subunit-like protein
MKVFLDFDFHAGQRTVYESAARFRVLAAGRRWGKTRLGVSECVEVGLKGGRAWWVAPTYPLANEGWRPLRMIGQTVPGAKILEMDKEVRLPGGGIVQVRSADDPQRLRGAGLDFVVVDEAAFCKQEAWEEALRPALSDRQGRAMFISTPKGRNWFADLYDRAEARDDWERFQFATSANPFMPPGEVEIARQELPSLVFQQEYLAEFVEAKGARYDSAWFRFFVPSVKDGLTWLLRTEGAPVDYRECERFCTVDLAASLKTSADWTVIASCAAWQGHLFVLDVVRRRMEGPDIVPAIRDQFARHDLRVAHIESSGFQLALVQEARREGLPVRELRPDRDKVARSLPLEARMEHGQVWFPRDASWLPDLQRELLAFPLSDHDDQVDALAYAAAVMSQPGKTKHDWSAAKDDPLAGGRERMP